MPKLYVILIAVLAVSFGADQAVAKDDGGFGTSRFTGRGPVALGNDAPMGGVIAQTKVEVSPTSPADIEPAAGEEDVTPEVEQLDDSIQMQKPEHPADTITIQKEITVR